MNAGWAWWWSKVSSAIRRTASTGRRVGGVELLLGLPDAAVGVLEHRQVEPLLAAEVVVDHPLRGAGPLGDDVDPRAGVALLGEDLGGDREQLGAGAVGVAQPLGTRLGWSRR